MAQADFDAAKAFLLQSSSKSGLNLYDHITGILTKVLDEKPNDSVDTIEELSQQLKVQTFNASTTVQDRPEVQEQVTLASARMKLFQGESQVDDDDAAVQSVPNVPEIAAFFESADIGLGREETFRVFLALKQLAEQEPLQTVSFWGKINGLDGNYVVAEAEYKEGEEPQPEEEGVSDSPINDDGEGEEDEDVVPLPKSQFKPTPPLPNEDYRSGANKKVYYVCSEPGQPWTVLPHVTPAQIAVSRKIKKFLTGRLDAKVVSYPPFPGNESNLLRAQIARITSATHVSPLGFYTFDEEDEDDEDARDTFIEDEEFEGKTRPELLAEDMSGWAHHTQYLLPQGRCKWENPNPKNEDDDEEGSDDEDEDEDEGPEPESGPALLTPLQNDDPIDGGPSWSPRLSSAAQPAYACVCISSNRWPGAHAFAQEKRWGHVYIGWGLKFSSDPFSPELPPPAQSEYPNGGDITETADPTREEEEEFEASQNAAGSQDGSDAEDDEDED